jgi:hypothetical protein
MFGIKGAIDRHSNDLLIINNEVKRRPLADSAVSRNVNFNQNS